MLELDRTSVADWRAFQLFVVATVKLDFDLVAFLKFEPLLVLLLMVFLI